VPENILPKSITDKLHTDNYARILIYIKTKDESELAFRCSDEILSIIKKYYPDQSYLIGETPCTQDIKSTITKDYELVDKISLLGVALVIAIAYRSLLIPLLVIIPIEIAIYINMAFPYLVGDDMCYTGYIIVSCIQLAATVDYGILMINNYMNNRTSMNRKESAIEAIKETTPPVLTSGMILAIVGYIMNFTCSIAAIASMGHLIGRGALCGVILVCLMLPALLVLFDKPIVKHMTRVRKRMERHLQKLKDIKERRLAIKKTA
jgi:predicted RND superfamily exporter protein